MDYAILDAIQTFIRSPLTDRLMVFVTHLGDMAFIWLVIAALLVAQPKYRQYGIAVFIAVFAAALLGMGVLKPLFGRLRPFETYDFTELLIPAPLGSSFPSNHALTAFPAASVLCSVPSKNIFFALLKRGSVILACLIAFSRLYLYVHYPSDVLAGACLGIGIGILIVKGIFGKRNDKINYKN